MNENQVLNISDLSQYLKCSISTIRNMIKKNEIPYFKIGAKYYFRLISIEEWIKRNERN